MARESSRIYVLEEFGPPEVLKLVERETPAPGPGEVLVEVEVAGINYADVMVRRGEYLRDQPLSMSPGGEVVGRIAAAGDGVAAEIGARVAVWMEDHGGYAEHVIAPANRAYAVPEDLNPAEILAVFIQGVTAYYALHRFGRVAAGETVLAHAAAGGVGGLSVQLAGLAGARAIGTASTAEKREIVLGNGADLAIDSRAGEELTEALREATGGSGVDVIIDGVGGPVFEPSLRAMAVGGRYVIAGSASQQPAMFDARRLLVRNQTICGFILLHITTVEPEEPQRTLDQLCELLRSGELRPQVEVVPMEAAPEVHHRIEARTVSGKIALDTRSG